MQTCFHCGDPCDAAEIKLQDKYFCCHGCKTVYEILNENNLNQYYDLESNPGVAPQENAGKFDFLDNGEIVEKLLDFDEDGTQVVSFLIPSMHCSSCIWVLENLEKLNPAVQTAQVNFPKKTVRITFSSNETSLKEVVLLLNRIGYEPTISLEDSGKTEKKADRELIYKLGIAGFAFGNVMFLSFPEYFEVDGFWLDQYKHVFRWLMFAFSLPVVFYSAQHYFISAFKGMRSGLLNIDVPIAIGVSVLFLRSTFDIVFDLGSGFFDSLTGLVFFLLVGRFFQQKAYGYLSFERDYKSYFPIAVTCLSKNTDGRWLEKQVEVYNVDKGDRLLIRNNELIPVDAVLLKGSASIDYSFVTGEAEPVQKESGDKLFAGGKQQGGALEVEVLKPVEQSYLTQLWSNAAFEKDKTGLFKSLTDRIGKRFTIAVLSVAIAAGLFWLFIDYHEAFNVFTAVLIIACPCAIALAAPFTLGNLLRIFGRKKLYLKETAVIEKMAQVDVVVFDKTGTLTTSQKSQINYSGIPLSEDEEELLNSSLQASSHPLSRSLYEFLEKHDISTLDEFQEETGKGIRAQLKGDNIKIGSREFVGKNKQRDTDAEAFDQRKTRVHISSNEEYKGFYSFKNHYRSGLKELMQELGNHQKIIVLSGDNDGERENLETLLPAGTAMYFNQKPENKLDFIKQLQEERKNVMMVGDGLNDAGALRQSDVGIAISENINVFSPACDGILDAAEFEYFPDFFALSRKGISIIKWAFVFSLLYNVVGVAFAVTGYLRPVVAAILMPLSSISIVAFTSLASQYVSRILKTKKNAKT